MLIGTVLYGVAIHQVYRYYRMYPSDKVWLKALVTTLFLLDTLTAILWMHICYIKLVSNFFKPENLMTSIWSLKMLLWVFLAIQTATHIFYAWRIMIIVKKKALLLMMALLIATTLGFSLYVVTEAIFEIHITVFVMNLKWYIVVMFTCSAVTDIFFAITTCFGLYNEKTENHMTRTIINAIMRNIIASGILTSFVSIATIILIITMPDNLIFLSTSLFLGRFDVNCVFANLNSRSSLRGHLCNKENWNTIGSFGLDKTAKC